MILLPKPLEEDLAAMREGQVLWGWPHLVQNEEMTQLAIDRRLTVIAWESMNDWAADGSFTHVFHLNNELAGYCSVLHAMQLTGTTGKYGRRLSAAVISLGATGRGAVKALDALGVGDIRVLTHRDVRSVSSPVASAEISHFERSHPDSARCVVSTAEGRVPMARFLAGHDIVVNCVLQDPDSPLLFVIEDELSLFMPGTLFVDVSCDSGMGFSWARPTSFEDPIFTVGGRVHNYGVDHSPSHLWNSATWEISEALLPYLPIVAAGPDAWDAEEVLRRAIEIRDGVVQNPKALAFQGRAADFPHARRDG